ncbi:acyl-CoA dehydrogenase [Streptomyces sp. NPDC058653]|uniref:acyl-CoA dehydrogenase family protein n=1 Tax=Streptomyces sp. NPDC058653 TaxID=3346576 RepID=UPI003667F053
MIVAKGMTNPINTASTHESSIRVRELEDVLFPDGPEGDHARWRKLICSDLFRHPPHASDEERQQLAYERLRAVNEELLAPEELARDPRALAALHEWTALVDGATTTVAGIHYNLFLGSVLDDTLSPARPLEEFTALKRVGIFLCTERAHGNDVAALQTTACYDRRREEFVLHTPDESARKFMPNAGAAGGPKSGVVAARLMLDGQDQGVFLFLTPLTDHEGPLPGISVEPMPGRIGSPLDHCVTGFDHVRLPRTALIQGPHGQLTDGGAWISEVNSTRKRVLHSIRRVTVGKLCMSAATLGGSRAALAIAVRYAYRRTVSSPVAGQRIPIAAHRSHHAPLLRHVATAYAMTFLHRAVTDRWVTRTPEDRAAAERFAAVAKGWITWQARDITVASRERCGARGLFAVNGLAEFPGNAEGAITAEGDNLAIWCKAGSEMIFGRDLAPTTPPATGTEDLTDPVFLRALVAAAERHWHSSARGLLRGSPQRDTLGRWNNASAAALELVETSAVGSAADAFIAACRAVDHPPTRTVLGELCALFLLAQLQPRSGQLLADEALTPAQVRELPETVRVLTGRLFPHLPALTDAFTVPEEHLASLPMLTGF